MNQLILVILLASAAAIPDIARAADAPVDWKAYRAENESITKTNIFLRDRGRRATVERTSSTPREAPRPPEKSFIVTGIVVEDGKYRAYLENMASNTLLRLNVGDSVARGTIADIEVDAIIFEMDGQQTRIDVGRDLTGGAASRGAGGSAGTKSSSATQPAAGSDVNPNNPNLSMEERMRIRRQQEMNR